MLSISGFIVQFFGLRGMHYSATLAQLAATFLMTAVRAVVRRGLAQLPTADRLLVGHEVDWLAYRTGKIPELSIRAGFTERQPRGLPREYPVQLLASVIIQEITKQTRPQRRFGMIYAVSYSFCIRPRFKSQVKEVTFPISTCRLV